MKKKRVEKKGQNKSKALAITPEMKEDNLNPRNLPIPVNVNPQALMAQAISSNLPVEQFERLMAMRRELKAEWAREQFFIALSKFQSEVPQIPKTMSVMNKPEKGGGLRYKFPPIENVLRIAEPYLERNGFSYSFGTEQTDSDVTSICVARHRDGHEERSKFAVPIDKTAYMTDQQKVASAVSFADRYSFKRLFGIVFCGEDDDTNGFGGETQKTKPPTPPQHPGKVPYPTTSKPETKKSANPNEISDHEKCVAFAGRIGSFAIAQLEGDESKTKEWMLKTTSRLKGQGIQIREHATFRSMTNAEIIVMFEAMRKDIETFENVTAAKEKTDGK